MQTTTNIGLKTYEAGDPTDWLGEFNYNMNKIDTAVGAQNDAIDVIEETAGTAVSTANTASATATEALNTAESKTSINDNVASASTTYSSNKINDLISGIEPGTEIDDSVTSTTKTWSSSKINTEVSSKASINDTTASNTTTYSSNKIDELLSYDNYASYYSYETPQADNYNYDHDITINEDGFYIIESIINAKVTNSSTTYPGKLFTNGISEINLKRNNSSYSIAKESKLSSLDFTNVINHTYVNNVNSIIFKNNASLFLKAGDVINIKNTEGDSDIVQTWKFISNVKIYRLY
jgi:hypothetical protein